MITKSELTRIIDSLKSETINIGRDIFENPELGFKEFRTSEVIKTYLNDLDLPYEDNISITGVRTTIGNPNATFNIGIICEMDAVPTKGHPYSSNDLDAAHSCAHSNQVAIMLSVVKALKISRFFENMDGKLTFIATPSEEYTDFEYRESLIREDKIRYCSGKQDMLYNGVFEDIDLIISCHTMGSRDKPLADINSTLNGFIKKSVSYHGKAAHAGACPHLGINALNAANIGLMSANTQRETFEERDYIRFHSIITNGGHTVNTIPDLVTIDAYVRGNTLDGMLQANKTINRALEAGAYATGCAITIEDTLGYMPFTQCRDLSYVLKENISEYVVDVIDSQASMASGDIGDVGYVIPTIQFGFSGFSGNVHGPNFEISDEETAYIIPGKAIVKTLYDLYKNNGALAKEIIANNPRPTYNDYKNLWLDNNVTTINKDFSK